MNCNKTSITQNTVNLCDPCLIPGHKFTLFCVMLALLQFICSRYSVWCLSYYSSQVHGILCDACLITVHRFMVLCVMLVVLQFTSSQYCVCCLPYHSSQVHGILCDACLIKIHKFTVFCVLFALVNCNQAGITQNTVNLWIVIRQASHRIPWTYEL
jgi:hypothetical protein